MSDLLPLPPVALGLVAGVIGFALGLAYFAAMRRTVALFAGGRGWLGPLALTLARVGAAVLFLAAVAAWGALPLLAAFAGFLVARAQALRAARKIA